MKKTCYLFFLALITFISGCSSFNTVSTKDPSDYIFTQNSEIILKTGFISGDINIIGVRDENTFYCFQGDNRQEVHLYQVCNSATKRFSTVISPKKYIKAIAFNEKWMVWVEDEVMIESESNHKINWAIYAKNLQTGEVIEIDKYNNIKPDQFAFFQAIEPRELSIYGDTLVYDNYTKTEEGVTVQAILMFDLSKKEMVIIDYIKDYKDSFYSHPKIYGNYITWSQSKVNLSDYSEKGSTYLYNIEKKEKKKITDGEEILWPFIFGDYIAARKKPNGQNDNSSILFYNINSNKYWTTIISPSSNIYQGKIHVEMGMVVINGPYLTWRDNINSKIIIYNYLSNKFYILASTDDNSETFIPIGLFNKIIFWYETRSNPNSPKEQKSLVKYAILK